MDWKFLLSTGVALAYLAWTWRDGRRYGRVGKILGSAGIIVLLTCACISTLPSHAPLSTLTGLATDRTFGVFDHSHSDFILIEEGTGRRVLLTTLIDGPWEEQPVRATYVNDGRFVASVVRIEILRGDLHPWQVEEGHAGWVGTTEPKDTSRPS
jgi:hypothetical protein